MANTLYYGDNLDIMRRYVPDESVDLVYADPPFKSNQNYNVLFQEKDGSRAASQILAFEDTWTWDQEDEAVYADLVTRGGKVADCLQAFRQLIGPCDMLSYLVMMAPRLVECRRALKTSGSMYLHCDPAASHYLKLLMDSVFEPANFRNEIVWQRTSAHNDPSQYGRVHDVLLFYAKGTTWFWATQYDAPEEAFFKAHDFETDENGRHYRKRDLTAPAHGGTSGQYEWKGKRPPGGRMWSYTEENMRKLEAEGRIVYTRTGMPRLKIYVEDLKGVSLQDVWVKSALWLNSAAKERLGYPTQKPVALLERIIRSSCPEGGTVLDPFCGCGTSITAAQTLGRAWTGIDITHLAITLMKERLKDTFGGEVAFQVIGEPVSVPDAERLAASDPYQFQWWALGLVGARPVEGKKGADKGIDGKIVFQGDRPGAFESVIISVKAGHTNVAHVRDLRGVLDRDKAALGVLISMQTPTAPMIEEAVSSGFFESQTWGRRYPKIQLLTVADLLSGKLIDMPPIKQVGATFKKSPRAVSDERKKQSELGL